MNRSPACMPPLNYCMRARMRIVKNKKTTCSACLPADIEGGVWAYRGMVRPSAQAVAACLSLPPQARRGREGGGAPSGSQVSPFSERPARPPWRQQQLHQGAQQQPGRVDALPTRPHARVARVRAPDRRAPLGAAARLDTLRGAITAALRRRASAARGHHGRGGGGGRRVELRVARAARAAARRDDRGGGFARRAGRSKPWKLSH